MENKKKIEEHNIRYNQVRWIPPANTIALTALTLLLAGGGELLHGPEPVQRLAGVGVRVHDGLRLDPRPSAGGDTGQVGQAGRGEGERCEQLAAGQRGLADPGRGHGGEEPRLLRLVLGILRHRGNRGSLEDVSELLNNT